MTVDMLARLRSALGRTYSVDRELGRGGMATVSSDLTVTHVLRGELLTRRHIYEKVGFHLIREEPHYSFGHDLIGQTWELRL